MPVTAWLGGEQPHDAVIGKWADGVDKGIYQVAVVIAPPQEHYIDHIVVVVIDDLDTLGRSESLAQLAVGVVIGADLPHHGAGRDPQGTQHSCLAGHGRLLHSRATGVVHRT